MSKFSKTLIVTVFIYMVTATIPAILIALATGWGLLNVYAGVLGLKFLVNLLVVGTRLEQKHE